MADAKDVKVRTSTGWESLRGPEGPSAVSADAGNLARTGTDGLIFVSDFRIYRFLDDDPSPYTLQLSDAGRLLIYTASGQAGSAGDYTIVIPDDETVPIPIQGAYLYIANSAGDNNKTLTITTTEKVVLRPVLDTAEKRADIHIGPKRGWGILFKVATDLWHFLPGHGEFSVSKSRFGDPPSEELPA